VNEMTSKDMQECLETKYARRNEEVPEKLVVTHRQDDL
jgi:hypothetical protein